MTTKAWIIITFFKDLKSLYNRATSKVLFFSPKLTIGCDFVAPNALLPAFSTDFGDILGATLGAESRTEMSHPKVKTFGCDFSHPRLLGADFRVRKSRT